MTRVVTDETLEMKEVVAENKERKKHDIDLIFVKVSSKDVKMLQPEVKR